MTDPIPLRKADAATLAGSLQALMPPAAPRRRSLMEMFLPNQYEGLGLVDPETAKDVRRNAIMRAGLTLMAAGGRRPRGTMNTGTALLGAFDAAQGAAGQGFEQAAQVGAMQQQQAAGAQQAAQRQAIFSKLGITGQEPPAELFGKLQQAMMAAIQIGDSDSARAISEVAKSMAGMVQPQKQEDRFVREKIGDTLYIIDKATNEVVRQIKNPSGTGEGAARKLPQPQAVTGPDGQTRLMAWDGERGQFVEVPGGFRPASVRGLTEGQAKARAFVESVDTDAKRIEDALSRLGLTDKGLASLGQGNIAQLVRAGSPQAQLLANSATTLAEAWLRMTTGAAYNEIEYNNALKRYTILPTDAPDEVRWKLGNMRRLQNMLRIISASPALREQFESGQGGITTGEEAPQQGNAANVDAALNGAP